MPPVVGSSKAVVLLSGGMDSAATLALYLHQGVSVSALFVDYGQAARIPERRAAQSLAHHYSISLHTVQCTGLRGTGEGYVRGRNALLVQLGLAHAPFETGHIAIGLIAGSGYPDCSKPFVQESQRVLDLYCDGQIRLVAPFVDDDKRVVLEFCRSQDVPIHLTYSCETGGPAPCGNCLSCRDVEALRAA